MAAGMAGWLTIPQAPQARIIVENDVNDVPGGFTHTASCDSYDPYFIPENRCDHILILAVKSK